MTISFKRKTNKASSLIIKSQQLSLLSKMSLAYGGELLKKRKGRMSGRPLSTKDTIHLVLRSSKATGKWSFKQKNNEKMIAQIITSFAQAHMIQLISLANVGNHLHLQIKLSQRHTYKKFIRAITASIAMKITGTSRWKSKESLGLTKFWDYRPFTRIVKSFTAYLNLRDYIKINQLEGYGYRRHEARFLVKHIDSSA